jgi:hypothetical protein
LAVPLDSSAGLGHAAKTFRVVFTTVQRNLSYLGIFFALGSFAVTPSVLFGAFVAGHIGMAAIFKRLSKPALPKSSGSVRDTEGKNIAKVIVRIFDKEYNKLLETQVTGRDGRYGFLVGPNVFYVTASKPGYATFRTPDIDLTGAEGSTVIAKNVVLEKLPTPSPTTLPGITMPTQATSATVSHDA